MKIFTKDNTHWENKVNFVDENNVYFGYDMNGQCCEQYGWFVADKISIPNTWEEFDGKYREPYQDVNAINKELVDFVFDTSYFNEFHSQELNQKLGNDLTMVILRIVNQDHSKEKFIHVYNCHNGYYSHGFEFKDNENSIQEGSI